jgi:hypothetical protein
VYADPKHVERSRGIVLHCAALPCLQQFAALTAIFPSIFRSLSSNRLLSQRDPFVCQQCNTQSDVMDRGCPALAVYASLARSMVEMSKLLERNTQICNGTTCATGGGWSMAIDRMTYANQGSLCNATWHTCLDSGSLCASVEYAYCMEKAISL